MLAKSVSVPAQIDVEAMNLQVEYVKSIIFSPYFFKKSIVWIAGNGTWQMRTDGEKIVSHKKNRDFRRRQVAKVCAMLTCCIWACDSDIPRSSPVYSKISKQVIE